MSAFKLTGDWITADGDSAALAPKPNLAHALLRALAVPTWRPRERERPAEGVHLVSDPEMCCPNRACQHPLRVPAAYRGRRVKCKHCHHEFRIPENNQPVQPTETSAAPALPGSMKEEVDALTLNHEQRLAAEINGSHVLVLVGAGSGKTRTIIARAAFLIRAGVDPTRILVMTFTRRAARELTQRLETLVGASSARIAAGTFHHFCLSTMRRMPRRFGTETATVIDRDDQIQLMKLVRGSFAFDKEPFPKASILASLYSYAVNTNRPVREYLEKHTDYDTATIESMSKVFTSYEDRKRKNSYLDYDDILFRFAKVVHEQPHVRSSLCGLYDHILVDEMQDTNPLQWLILDGLRDPAKLFCVGDDAQSIYAFRGADFQNVHSFNQRVCGSVVLKLEENYRSIQEILDVANWLLKRSPLPYDRVLRAHRGKGAKPRLIDFESDLNEANWIAEDLVRRHDEGVEWGEHMILTRTAWGSRPMEAALVERRIPYEFIGGTRLSESAHVKDLLSLIRCAQNHLDELAWVRYLTLWPRIGDVTSEKLITGMSRCPDFQSALGHLRASLRGRPEILEGPDVVLKHSGSPPEAIAESGRFLEPILERRYDRWESRRKDFALLERIAERHKSLVEFLDTFTLDPVSATGSSRNVVDDAVALTTVHSAKGTEARVCYLIRVEPGIYPHVRGLGDRDQEEEDRRVLYVALTRAQDELIITRTNSHANKRVLWGGAAAAHSEGGTPYFLQDVPDNLVDMRVEGFEPPKFSASQGIVPMSRNP